MARWGLVITGQPVVHAFDWDRDASVCRAYRRQRGFKPTTVYRVDEITCEACLRGPSLLRRLLRWLSAGIAEPLPALPPDSRWLR